MTTDHPAPASDQPRTLNRKRKSRPSPAVRRMGYAVAIAVNAVLIYLIYVAPGWRVLPFLTEDAASVMALVVMSMVVSIAVNVIWLAYDPLWLRSLGELVTTIVGIVVIVRILTVFPFTFPADSPWEFVVRFVLIVALVGSCVGVVANLATFGRQSAAEPNDDTGR